MARHLLAVAALLALASPAAGATWKTCGESRLRLATLASHPPAGKGVMTPETVTLTPDPAVAGKDIAIDVTGNSGAQASRGQASTSLLTRPPPVAEVKDGKISVTVSLDVGGAHVPIYSLAIALCDTLTCPAEPGPITVHYGLLLPGSAPAVRGASRSNSETRLTAHPREAMWCSWRALARTGRPSSASPSTCRLPQLLPRALSGCLGGFATRCVAMSLES